MLISLAAQVALVVKMVKNPLCQCRKCKTWVWFLGWEYPLEEEMANHYSILAREIPRTEEPGGQSTGQRVGCDWAHMQGIKHFKRCTQGCRVCVSWWGELESPCSLWHRIKFLMACSHTKLLTPMAQLSVTDLLPILDKISSKCPGLCQQHPRHFQALRTREEMPGFG